MPNKPLLKQEDVCRRFEKLNLKLISDYVGNQKIVECQCFCGKIFKVKPVDVFRNHTKSCGCFRQKFHPNLIDLCKQKFGKLTVVKLSNIVNGNGIWECICDCGNIVNAKTSLLKNKHITSCGCNMYQYNKGDKNYMWKGIGDLSGRQWSTIQNNATVRNLPFEISIHNAWDKFIEQGQKCSYMKKRIHVGIDASLDRIDSNKGYVIDNIQWVHKDINNMKWDLDHNDFIKWCYLITNPIQNSLICNSCIVNKKNHNFSGCGNIPKSYWSSVNRHATKRQIHFDISIDECWQIFLSQRGYCALTGVPIYLGYKNFSASLDRIDSNKGYVIDNIQWVHKDINCKIKKNLSEGVVKQYARIITRGNNLHFLFENVIFT